MTRLRLMDRDKLIGDLTCLACTEKLNDKVWDVLEDQPVIDAIPLEWICKEWLNNYYDMPESAKIVIRTMIGNWREENANHN